MADGNGFKPIWQNPAISTMDLPGDLATDRGSDPNIDPNAGAGNQAFKPIWDNDVTPEGMMDESSNSVSGLPSLPNRFAPEPSTPPPPPGLKDRIPGTIDQK